MLRRAPWLLALLLFALPASAATSVDWQSFAWDDVYTPGGEVRDGMLLPGRLVVTFEPGSTPDVVMAKGPGTAVVTGEAALDAAAEALGLHSLERLFAALPANLKAMDNPERGLHFVAQFDADRHSLREAAARLATLPGVTSVEPDPMGLMHANIPNDPGFGSQWWLRANTQGAKDIRGLAAWYHNTGSSDVVVCVADSGVDWQHPDLGGTGPDYTDGVIWINDAEYNGNPGQDDDSNGKIDDIRGWDFVTGVTGVQNPPQDTSTQDNDPMDYDGHGTWVSGCVSAITNNGIGVTSTTWNTKIMACRIGWLPEGSDSGVVLMSFAAQAMDYARINGADIFNASWGSVNTTSLRQAVNSAVLNGMVVVSSAGNDNNTTASYLCGRTDVISVAATTESDGKASFSSYGGWVDIAAPGVSIYTTAYDRFSSGSAAHVYGAPQGTSFSSPIVCGGFALAKAAYPGDTRTELIDRVLAAVDDLDALNPAYIGQLGSGRLNIAKLFDNPMWLIPDQLETLVDAFNISEDGDTVAVRSDALLNKRVSLPAVEVAVLGGWDATFTTRDPINAKSVMVSPGGSGPLLQAANGTPPGAVFDGFEIQNGVAILVSFEPVDGYYGGGVLLRDASPTLRNLDIVNGQAGTSLQFGAGGGIAVIGGSPTLEDVTISGSSALRGAGMYIYRATPTLRRVSITNNTVYTNTINGFPQGGGVYILDSPTPAAKAVNAVEVVFEDVIISGHDVTTGGGGGIYSENSDVRLERTVITANTSDANGAGASFSGGSLTVVDSEFRENSINVGNFTAGGGLYTSGASVDISGSTFAGNNAGFHGGGASILAPGSFSIDSSFFVENTAGIFGTGVYMEGTAPGAPFTGNTVAYNSGASSGGNGAYLVSGDLAVSQNVFAFNGDGTGALADGFNTPNGTATFSCNLAWSNGTSNYGGVADPTGSNDNIEADPAFCDAMSGDYNIATNSPAAVAVCGVMGAGAASCQATDVDNPITVRAVALQQNVPNPFNPRTEIAFALPEEGPVSLRVFDVRGRLVKALVDGPLEAGEHQIPWNGVDREGRSVASGTYFYELLAGGQRHVRKMGLLK